MPAVFANWLRNLNDADAAAVWEYFDGSFTNCEDVSEIIAESHRELCKRTCGHYPEEIQNIDQLRYAAVKATKYDGPMGVSEGIDDDPRCETWSETHPPEEKV